MFFINCMKTFLRQLKKFLVWLINKLFCNTIHQHLWVVDKWWIHYLFPAVFFLQKAVLDLLVFCSLHTCWFSLVTSGETTFWKIWVCSVVCWDWFCLLVTGISLATELAISSSSRMQSICSWIFWSDVFFSNRLYIPFTWCISQILFLNTFSFLFVRLFYLSIQFLSHLILESSVSFYSNLFQVSGCFWCFFRYCEWCVPWISLPWVTRSMNDNW